MVVDVPDKSSVKLNWPFVRKLEALVFTSMFLAVPFFAVRIVDIAGTSLMVQNTAVDLVKDLIRAREIAKDYGLSITVSSAPATGGSEACSYLIQNGMRTIEQVVLPRGVVLVGSVTFDDKGDPQNRASFVVTKGARTNYVEVDTQGQTSLH